MGAAEQLGTTALGRVSWVEICEQHPNEWVCLFDLENAADGSICSGRVIGHGRSMRRVLAGLGTFRPTVTRTAAAHESGYLVQLVELSALGVAEPGFTPTSQTLATALTACQG